MFRTAWQVFPSDCAMANATCTVRRTLLPCAVTGKNIDSKTLTASFTVFGLPSGLVSDKSPSLILLKGPCKHASGLSRSEELQRKISEVVEKGSTQILDIAPRFLEPDKCSSPYPAKSRSQLKLWNSQNIPARFVTFQVDSAVKNENMIILYDPSHEVDSAVNPQNILML